MKKIGLIGGLGPESTLDYYSGIINPFKSGFKENGFPEIIVNSLNLRKYLTLAEKNLWIEIAEDLIREIKVLEEAGADFGVIASNTPHKVFDQVQEQTSLPLLSIVEATCEFARENKLNRLCLLGTRFTMSADFYQKKFNRHGIELFVPDEQDQDFIQIKLFSEIEFGIIRPETQSRFLDIYQKIHHKYHTEGLILGCTELPLIIKPEDIDEAYLDTTAIHIDKIVQYCLAD